MEKLKLGSLVSRNQLGVRDAIHVPVMVVSPRHLLAPGASVVVVDNYLVEETHVLSERHGIIDPYLADTVDPTDACLLIIDPEAVSEVRHDFKVRGFDYEQDGVIKKLIQERDRAKAELDELKEDYGYGDGECRNC